MKPHAEMEVAMAMETNARVTVASGSKTKKNLMGG